jgi:hypothetical protein
MPDPSCGRKKARTTMPRLWGCTIYPSNVGAPVVTMIHGGGHMVPREASALIVKFFKEEPAAATPANKRGDPGKSGA